MNKILYLFAFSLILSYVAFFEEAYAQQEIDYKKLESIGLLKTGDKQSLGADLYRHAKRSELVYLLKNINRTPWYALQSTIKNLLITAADSTAINNDIEITQGNDLLTLRITALMRMGYNKEAFELYNKASSHDLSEPLMRAGIFSMLLNKQKARACLEVKTSFENYKDIEFWKEMNAYCMLTLSKEPAPQYAQTINNSNHNILKEIIKDKNYYLVYEPQNFSKLSFIEKAILVAEDKISLPEGDFQFYRNIPPQHISMLFLQSEASENTKNIVKTIAVKYGYESPKVLSKIYGDILEKYKDKKPKDNDWYKLSKIYKDTKSSWIPKKRKDKISEAFDIAQKYDISVLIPLLPAIVKMEIGDDLSLENAYRVLPLFLLDDSHNIEDWIEDIVKLSFDDQALQNKRLNMLSALHLMVNIQSKKLKNQVITNVNNHLSSSPYKAALKNIIENIDSGTNNGDKVRYIGVNGFDLIWNKRYTMPPYVVLKALNQSSKNQDISISLLLSAYILGNINSKDLYVGTMSDIVIAFNDLGLKRLSYLTMAQAILEMED